MRTAQRARTRTPADTSGTPDTSDPTERFRQAFAIRLAALKAAAIQLEGSLEEGGKESDVFAALDTAEAECRRIRGLMRKYTAQQGRGLRANGQPDHRWGVHREPDKDTDLRFLR